MPANRSFDTDTQLHWAARQSRHIICLAALALRWRPRVTSNVRPQKTTFQSAKP
jgi:hypothetical protein